MNKFCSGRGSAANVHWAKLDVLRGTISPGVIFAYRARPRLVYTEKRGTSLGKQLKKGMSLSFERAAFAQSRMSSGLIECRAQRLGTELRSLDRMPYGANGKTQSVGPWTASSVDLDTFKLILRSQLFVQFLDRFHSRLLSFRTNGLSSNGPLWFRSRRAVRLAPAAGPGRWEAVAHGRSHCHGRSRTCAWRPGVSPVVATQKLLFLGEKHIDGLKLADLCIEPY